MGACAAEREERGSGVDVDDGGRGVEGRADGGSGGEVDDGGRRVEGRADGGSGVDVTDEGRDAGALGVRSERGGSNGVRSDARWTAISTAKWIASATTAT